MAIKGTGKSRHAIRDPREARKLVVRRHPEYNAYAVSMRQILDTLEGGPTYRDAVYPDAASGTRRNLAKLKREQVPPDITPTDAYGAPMSYTMPQGDMDRYNRAIQQDYNLRLENTPTPDFLSSFIKKQLGSIYKKAIQRSEPTELTTWRDNVDRQETTLTEMMQESVAPLLCALGMIDVMLLHPYIPEDEVDILYSNQDPQKSCVLKVILPDRVVWWKNDYTGRYYKELLVVETFEVNGQLADLYRHWTNEDWTLYNEKGDIIDEGLHNFGLVPIVRLFDQRMLTKEFSPKSRMWHVVDLTRQFYNEESVTIANLITHCCPVLVGPPEEQGKPNQSVPIGRNFMLRQTVEPITKTLAGYNYLSPATEPGELMRLRLFDLMERMENSVALTRTTGAVGRANSAGPVAQSGISKAYDQENGSTWLASIAKTLEIAEYTICWYALVVIHDGYQNVPSASFDALTISYPRDFNLLNLADIAELLDTIGKTLLDIGHVATAEKLTLKKLYGMLHPDMDEKTKKEIDKEIDTLVDDAVKSRKEQKSRPQLPAVPPDPGAAIPQPGGLPAVAA